MELGISVQSFNADLLYEPWEVYAGKGQAYTTFEAYWDKCLHMQRELVTRLPPWKLISATGTFQLPKIFVCARMLVCVFRQTNKEEEFITFIVVSDRDCSKMFTRGTGSRK